MVLLPETRFEAFLAKIAGQEGPDLEPITRTEAFLDDIAGAGHDLEPRTRIEYWLQKIAENAGGGGGGDQTRWQSKYTLSEDTTIQDFISSIDYSVHTSNFARCVVITITGDTAPTTGMYTLNNIICFFVGDTVIYSWHWYVRQLIAPNACAAFPAVLESAPTQLLVSNGKLTSGSTAASNVGTAGSVVTLTEWVINDAL